MSKYAVIDDYGDDWEDGYPIFESDSLEECEEWAEEENYHSASIVSIMPNGQRVKVN